MCVGGYSRFKRSLIFLLILLHLAYSSYLQAHPALILGRSLIGTLISRAVVLRGASMGLPSLTATRFAMQKAANDALFKIPVTSALRYKSLPTWAGLAASLSGLSVSDIANETPNLKIFNQATKLNNGTYNVEVQNGSQTKTFNVDFEPTILNPVFLSVKSEYENLPAPIYGVSSGSSVPENSMYYVDAPSLPHIYYGSNIKDIALSTLKLAFSIDHKPEYNNESGIETILKYDKNGHRFYEQQDKEASYIKYEAYANYDYISIKPSTFLIPESLNKLLAGQPSYHQVYFTETVVTKRLDPSFNFCNEEIDDNGNEQTICSLPVKKNYSVEQRKNIVSKLVQTNFNFKASSFKFLKTSSNETETLSDAFKSMPINLEALTKLLNALMFKASATEDYKGIPFSTSKPFTKAEVMQALKDLNIDLSAFDWFAPALNGSELDLDMTKEYNIIINNNVTNHYNKPEENEATQNKDKQTLTFIPPEIEDIPDGLQILSPLNELMPFLKKYNIHKKNARCPIGQFEVFNKTYVIDSHCPLLESSRALFEKIMLIVWAFVSLRIILKA